MQTDPDTRLNDGASVQPSQVAEGRTVAASSITILRTEPIWGVLIAAGLLVPLLPMIPTAYLRIPLGIALVLFVPGYVVVRALFSGRMEPNGMYGAGMGFGISVAALPLIALMLDVSGIGITPDATLLALGSWTIFWTLLAFQRRVFSRGVSDFMTGEMVQQRTPPVRSVLIPLSILAIGVSTVVAILMSGIRESERLETEFFMLGEQEQARDYPYSVTAGDEISVTLGITNHHEHVATYSVSVTELNGPRHDSVEHLRTRVFDVEPGETRERHVSWSFPEQENESMFRIVLHKNDDTETHRFLTMHVEVVESQAGSDSGDLAEEPERSLE